MYLVLSEQFHTNSCKISVLSFGCYTNLFSTNNHELVIYSFIASTLISHSNEVHSLLLPILSNRITPSIPEQKLRL